MWTTHKIEGAGGVGGGDGWISESQQLYTSGYANAYWGMLGIDVKPDGSSIVLSGYANRTPATPADGQSSAQTILLDEDGSFVISKWNRYGSDTSPVQNSVRFGGDGWIYTATTGQPGSGRTIYSRNETTLAYGAGNGKYLSSGAIYNGNLSGQGSMNYMFGQQRPSGYIDGLISSYSGTNDSNQYLVVRRHPANSAITFNGGYVKNNILYAIGLNEQAAALTTYNTGGANGIATGLKYNNTAYITQFYGVTADGAGNIYTYGQASSIPFVTKWTSGGGMLWTKQIYHASYNLGIYGINISPITGDVIVTGSVGPVGVVFLSLDSANGSINWQFNVKSNDCAYTNGGYAKIDDNGIIYGILNPSDYPNLAYAKIAVIKFDGSDAVDGTFGNYVCAPSTFISQSASYTQYFSSQNSVSSSISSSTETGTQGTFAYNFTPISL